MTVRKPIIAGNWKMNKTVGEALELVGALRKSLEGVEGVEVVVAPPHTALYAVSRALGDSIVQLAAQDVFWEGKGAYTGEIAPSMLIDVCCSYVIIGHSERRQYFGETDQTVNRKLKAALGAGLKPIVCVGELAAEREAGKTGAVVERQVKAALDGIQAQEAASLVIAYEPVWAIGTGKTATPEQAQEVHALIRGLVRAILDADFAKSLRVQYGGSVTPENVDSLMAKPDVDGALVGGASLRADSFTRIVKFKAPSRG